MTVTSTLNKIVYSGTGATTNFTFPFPGVAASDIQVFFTSSTGVITQLATNQYTVFLNAPVEPNPTGIGGSVTYPIVGSPIPIGSFLTILRTVPLTQPTSLANQGTLYQPVIEGELDLLLMQIQQLNELLGRQITVAVSDPTPGPLPPAAQRASQWFGFDASGNPIAGQGATATVPISVAMQPVVGASTLPIARTALGLGNIATLNVGTGLVSDGTAVNITSSVEVNSTNQSVDISHNNHHHFATAPITYTFNKANTFFAGWTFFLSALNSPIVLAIDATDSFSGMASGVSLTVPAGTQVEVTTDAGNPGTWYTTFLTIPSSGELENVQLNATVGSNALTVSLKDRNGLNPSNTSPVIVTFRDPTVTNGNPVYRAITSGLSITVPNGATLGTANSIPCRIWIVLFDNAGTPVLGVINCLVGGATPTQIFPLQESLLQTGTAISAGSTSAATYYSASGVTSKSFRVLGYLDFNTGQTAAGAWASAPDKIQLYGPGIKKPGDLIQSIWNITGAVSTLSVAVPADDTVPTVVEGGQYLTQAITPQSAMNVLKIDTTVILSSNAGGPVAVTLVNTDYNGTNALAVVSVTPSTGNHATAYLRWLTIANRITSTTFSTRAGDNAGSNITMNGVNPSTRRYGGACSSFMQVDEIMV